MIPQKNKATKTVIITGANTGLGYECARNLAASNQGWYVVIACRDQAKGSQAARQLQLETGNSEIECLELDLASLASVRRFPADLARRNLPPLQALVCNAGVNINGPLTYTEDGFETTFGVNHLGHFLLVNLLLKELLNSGQGRIVVVSSGTHDPATIDGRFSPPQYQAGRALAYPEQFQIPQLTGITRYATSKLCNIFFTYELARQVAAISITASPRPPVTVNAYDPGATPGTGLIRNYPKPVQALWNSAVFRWMVGLFGLKMSTIATSGEAMARLILDPTLEGISGKYFQVFKERKSSSESYDTGKAAQLWQTSVELVGLTPEETVIATNQIATWSD